MSNIHALRASDLTPAMVLERALNTANVKTAYVILLMDDGNINIRGSGDLSDMPRAALAFMDLATACVVKGVEHE